MPKINIETYQGREHAYVKHFLLEKYLAPLAFKVGSAWPTIVYVDAFSGPWQTRDANYADSSFGVAIRVLARPTRHCAGAVSAYRFRRS